ncbi:hypothetical protein BJY52DRAFT_1184675 [Lactarius psammicola]|nr:hypothetical protein BJY52DRAFT_1184675 [Lactarius psammicola]
MAWLSTTRSVTFVTISLFALIAMCFSANLIALTEPFFYYKFAAFALATSLLTLFTVIPMFLIDMSIFSYFIVEIVWLSVLWVLWFSSVSYATWTDERLMDLDPAEISCNFGDGGINKRCHDIKAIMVFSFLIWFILMAYIGVLLFLAVRAQGRGRPVWKTSVREVVVFYPGAKPAGTPAEVPTIPASLPQSYPPAPAPGSVQV